LVAAEALLWAKRGDKRKAGRLIDKAMRGKSLLHTHHMLHYAAAACAVIEKPAQAVALLRKAVATGLPNYPAFRDDPHLQPLHTHPQFLRLMNDLKREWTSYQREFAAHPEPFPTEPRPSGSGTV
jgi:hypothetical protein